MTDVLHKTKAIWIDKTKRHELVLFFISILLIVILKNRYDYTDYEVQWQAYLNDGNPSGAYGPLHNSMAYLFSVNAKLPRLVFSSASILTSFYLYNLIHKNLSISAEEKKKFKFLLFYNPLIWIFFVVYGCNDGLVGALFLFGIIAYEKDRFILSSLLLSLAILYKYIPIFAIPFLCISNRKINWKFSLSLGGFLIAGFGFSYLVWGEKFLNPILFNASRESKILSVFRFLRGDYSPLKFFSIDSVDYLSTYLVVFSVITVFVFHILYNLKTYQSLVLSLMLVFLFYKVGHFQFYFSFILILIYYFNRNYTDMKRLHPLLLHKIWLFLVWIAFATFLYGITEGFYKRFEVIREFIGLPTFIIHLIMAVSFIIFMIKATQKRSAHSNAS